MDAKKLYFNDELSLEVQEALESANSDDENKEVLNCEFAEDRFEVSFQAYPDGQVEFIEVTYWNEDGDVKEFTNSDLANLGELFSLDPKAYY